MKFAKELEEDSVPEWRIKYLNYKAGKKYVKAVQRAVQRTGTTPRSLAQRTPSFVTPRSTRFVDEPSKTRDGNGANANRPTPGSTHAPGPAPKFLQTPQPVENEALKTGRSPSNYGSISAATPGSGTNARHVNASNLELPDPALGRVPTRDAPTLDTDLHFKKSPSRFVVERSSSEATLLNNTFPRRSYTQVLTRRPQSGLLGHEGSPLRRLFSHGPGAGNMEGPRTDYSMQDFDLVREREKEFYEFLDNELTTVESFYKLKEDQAGERLEVLKAQLHEMRNRRVQDMVANRHQGSGSGKDKHTNDYQDGLNGLMNPIKAKIFRPGPNSRSLQAMLRTPRLGADEDGDDSRDYTRRDGDEVPYRTAKRKLKLALQEFYRGMELLKSFALLNRTAFRKLNKKYDKAVHARPPLRYMTEKVNKSGFVNSDVLDGHIKEIEDLYARYFERGNRKLAAGKLRSLIKKSRDESGSTFKTGLLLGTGAVFALQGVTYGAKHLYDDSPEVRVQTSYLLQIYGGYFFMLLLFFLFCINCAVWTKNKINYPFIFEFDQRHHLDWRQLSEFPSLFLLLLGLALYFNFANFTPDYMYEYYPVILIGISVLIVLFPFPVFAPRSRSWFANSHGRLLLAGLYPVEFRDFFLGDMYCSLTYATANVELFFCVYGHRWENPGQCNSNHSRAMGFLTALPPIWRFLQCIRRYKDTRNIFPHLVNGGKYTMSIITAVTLSLYRIDQSRANLAIFATFATINAIYCSIWDIFMDFSLLQTESRNRGLRDVLALKSKWPYYTIMIVDPILRFGWIFYAIFTHRPQHSTIISFAVALMEVVRRGAWCLLRVENEHCANVAQYKASRDVPLPYRLEPFMSHADVGMHDHEPARPSPGTPAVGPGGTEEAGGATPTTQGATLGRRDLSKILAEAHKQDFVKKRKDEDNTAQTAPGGQLPSDDDDDDDDEEEEDEDENGPHQSRAEIAEAAELRKVVEGES